MVTLLKYAEILESVIASKEIKEYLIKKGLEDSVSYIEDIVMLAPVPITLKKDLLTQLASDVEKVDDYSEKDEAIRNMYLERHQLRKKEFKNYNDIIDLALHYMNCDGGVYVIENCEYDEDRKTIDYNFQTVCGSFSETKEWIRDYLETGEYADKDPFWHYVGVWDKDDKGKYIEIIGYTFFMNEVCYADISYESASLYGFDRLVLCEINVQVPFVPGDIVEINALPYAPPYRALITNVGDNRDCCCLQVMTQNTEGVWEIGALKHNQVANGTFPFVSPLYTATYYDLNRLSPQEKVMGEIQKYIDGSEDRGNEVWEYINSGGKTTNDLQRLIAEKKV